MQASAGAAFLAATIPLAAGPAYAWRPGQAVPAAHARPLLASKQGDVLILRNAAKDRLDHYCVREVYDPPVP